MIETVSLEVARKLKKYLPEGFESKFYWVDGLFCFSRSRHSFVTLVNTKKSIDLSDDAIFKAPLLCEMLKLLPRKFNGKTLVIDFDNTEIGYPRLCWIQFGKYSIATACALLYMQLVDNGYVEVNGE